tara:strand:- start:221 stop:622 length:402 start_codon:yes stop_codon:yes gene_type:complete
MATISGTSGSVFLQLVGTAEAIVGEVRTFNFDETIEPIDSTTMGDTAKNYTGGLKDGILNIDCFYDHLNAQQVVMDAGALLDIEINPGGTGSGQKKYTGVGLVTSRSVSNSPDGLVEATFVMQISNGLTEGTY